MHGCGSVLIGSSGVQECMQLHRSLPAGQGKMLCCASCLSPGAVWLWFGVCSPQCMQACGGLLHVVVLRLRGASYLPMFHAWCTGWPSSAGSTPLAHPAVWQRALLSQSGLDSI